MLAQSPPVACFSSDTDIRRAMGMGIDLSPSQLVTHSAQDEPHQLFDAQRQRALQLSLDQQRLLHSLATFDFNAATSGVQPSSQPMVVAGGEPIAQGQPSIQAPHSRSPPAPLVLNEATTFVDMNATIASPQQMSSSASFDNLPQTVTFSRRPGSQGSGSPNSAPADVLSFGRMNHAARQRTAQACEKCRDRKTKCSGTRPTCKRCGDRGLTCVWASDSRIRGPTRQSRQPRIDSGDNAGEPLSVLPVPLSESSSGNASPSLRGYGFAQSAPPFQTTFPAIALPSHLVRRDQQKRMSWNEGTMTGTVSKGIHALSIMGEPILPVDAYDDCWDSVERATREMQSRQRQSASCAKERSASVSVAHLARARSLRDEAQQITENEPTFSTNVFGSTPSFPFVTANNSNESIPPLGSSTEASENDTSLSHTTFQTPASSGFGLHQPIPSYDTSSQLSDEMMKLLNFPGQHSQSILDGVPAFADPIPSLSLDPNATSVTLEKGTKQNTEELFAQYFDTEAFS